MTPESPSPRRRGRPPKPTGTARPHIVKVYVTESELRALDADRGDRTRSAYLVGLMGVSGR